MYNRDSKDNRENKKVMIIGGGGREYAIANSTAKTNRAITHIYIAPGNGGTELLKNRYPNIYIENVKDLSAGSHKNLEIEVLKKFALDKKIDLVVVGPEALLVDGIVDEFTRSGIKIFGANKHAAMLEGSKSYAKEFMCKYGINTAKHITYSAKQYDRAVEYICDHYNNSSNNNSSKHSNNKIVLKASGLAGGKGVVVCDSKSTAVSTLKGMMKDNIYGSAGSNVVIEQYLDGVEASIMVFVDTRDGRSEAVPMVSVTDYKKLYNDSGASKDGETNGASDENVNGDTVAAPNTGGMGAIAPSPHLTDDIWDDFNQNILAPTMKGIAAENMEFCGVIFFGVMIVDGISYLLEYNMRMGDPETQTVLPLMQDGISFIDIVEDILDGNISKYGNTSGSNSENLYSGDAINKIFYTDRFACTVVAVSSGYPGSYGKGFAIDGIESVTAANSVATKIVSIAGADLSSTSPMKLVTSGGRVLATTAINRNLANACSESYSMMDKIKFDGIYYRKDITIK